LKNESNSGFSLVEMLVAIVILGLIVIGTRQMLINSQESNLRENLRKTHADMSQDLTIIITSGIRPRT
jgi:prepilin-type N-terminal cleavage/methylation domain-containing protein